MLFLYMIILQSSFPHYYMSIMFYIIDLLGHLKEQNFIWRSCQETVIYTTQGFNKLQFQLLFIESNYPELQCKYIW